MKILKTIFVFTGLVLIIAKIIEYKFNWMTKHIEKHNKKEIHEGFVEKPMLINESEWIIKKKNNYGNTVNYNLSDAWFFC